MYSVISGWGRDGGGRMRGWQGGKNEVGLGWGCQLGGGLRVSGGASHL